MKITTVTKSIIDGMNHFKETTMRDIIIVRVNNLQFQQILFEAPEEIEFPSADDPSSDFKFHGKILEVSQDVPTLDCRGIQGTPLEKIAAPAHD